MQAKTGADASNSNSNSAVKAEPAAGASAAAHDGDVGEDEHDGEGEDGEAEGGGKRTRKRRLGVDPSLIISDGRSKRRRTPSPVPVKKEEEADPKDPERAAALGREIYTKIMESKDREGESMAEPFIKLPSKLPDYYEVIKHPMSLDTVDAKLKNKEYQTLKEVVTDIGQIFNNAKRYNVKESLLFIYAKKLHKMTRTFYARTIHPDQEHHESEDEAPVAPSAHSAGAGARRASTARRDTSALGAASQSVEPDDDGDDGQDGNDDHGGPRQGPGIKRGSYMKNGPTVYKLVKPVLKIIKETKARDGSGRDIAGIFEYLPDRKDFAEYYAVIKNPISLLEIEDRMVGRKYESWEEFFDDVELMCANAMQYNEDGSEVYLDAAQIKEILDYNRAEIKTRLTLPVHQQRQRLKPANTPQRGPTALGTPGSSASGAIPLPTDPRRASGSPLPQGTAGYYGSPLAASSSNLHPHVPSNPHAPAAPYGGGSGSAIGQSPALSNPSAVKPQFVAPLPKGYVSEATVHSLDRYTETEKRAWLNSLSQSQVAQYRTFSQAIDARKRAAAGLPPPPMADPPSTARQVSVTGVPITALPLPTFKRGKPSVPGIKCFEFGFESERRDYDLPDDEDDPSASAAGANGDVDMDAPSPSAPGRPSQAGPARKQQRFIRLQNLRGVGTHCLLVGGTTTQLTLSAYYSDFVTNAIPSATSAEADKAAVAAATPQIVLKLNGVTLGGQTVISEPLKRLGPSDDTSSSPIGGINGSGPNGNGNAQPATPGSDATATTGSKPRGVRYVVDIPQSAGTNKEDELLVILSRPALGQPGAGRITEYSTIFISRQF